MYIVTLHIDNTKMLILHSVNTKPDSVLDDPLVVDFKLLSPVL